jgi:hypothetical protein
MACSWSWSDHSVASRPVAFISEVTPTPHLLSAQCCGIPRWPQVPSPAAFLLLTSIHILGNLNAYYDEMEHLKSSLLSSPQLLLTSLALSGPGMALFKEYQTWGSQNSWPQTYVSSLPKKPIISVLVYQPWVANEIK